MTKLVESFLEFMLDEFNLPDHFIWLIMRCASSISISILCNGEVLSSCIPSREFHQADPLSLLLFILCFFGLSALISWYHC